MIDHADVSGAYVVGVARSSRTAIRDRAVADMRRTARHDAPGTSPDGGGHVAVPYETLSRPGHGLAFRVRLADLPDDVSEIIFCCPVDSEDGA